MKRLITICIAVIAVALVASPAFAEVQNIKVSGDVGTTAVYREAYNLYPDSRNTTAEDSPHENFAITQARVRVDADLTDNVTATVRLLTEYDWGTSDRTAGTGDNVDLDIACVTLKEVFYGPLTLTVGRQELRYGNAFVIGDPDTNTTDAQTQASETDLTAGDLSLRKSFDAIRAVLDYDPLVIDLFWTKIDEDANMTQRDDEDIYGVNLAYDFGWYDTEAEAYVILYRDEDMTSPVPRTNDEEQLVGHEIYTYGVRGSIATPIDNLNLLGEVAFQRGDYDKHHADTKRDQDAYAYQIAGDYAFPDTPWDLLVRSSWTHYSGENTANDGDFGAWIPMCEDQTHGVVANYIFGGVNGGQNSNADILNVGISVVPVEDMSVDLDFYCFWLDEKLVKTDNAEPQTDSTGLGWENLTEDQYFMKTKDELGTEIDLAINYDYTEDVKMGLSAGWFVPGDALDGEDGTNKNDATALQVLATLDVAF